MLLALVALAPRAHAPTYDCADNCCHVNDYKHSQAFYLKGSGGVEFDIDHVDVANDEIIHWSVVLRGHRDAGAWKGTRPKKEDYQLFVGCGGCSLKDDADFVSADALLAAKDVERPVLEPFTQTSYYPVYEKEDVLLKFHSKALETCASEHFSVRLRVTNPAAEPFFWSPVLGCPGFDCEVDAFFGDGRFPGGIVEFPSFILRNQREDWNELYWPIWVSIALGFVVLVIVFVWPAGCCLRKCRKDRWGPPMQTMFWQVHEYEPRQALDWNGKPRVNDVNGEPVMIRAPMPSSRRLSPRAILYFLAMWSLLTSLFNSIFHMLYSTYSLDPDMSIEGPGAGIFVGAIVIFGHLAPMALLATIWGVHTYTSEAAWREFGYCGTRDSRCCGPYCWNYVRCGSAWWAHGGWSIVEFLFVGLAGFLWLGAGYYVFPTAVSLAAIFRFCWWLCAGRWHAMPELYRNKAGAAPLPSDEAEAVPNVLYDANGRPVLSSSDNASAALLPPLLLSERRVV